MRIILGLSICLLTFAANSAPEIKGNPEDLRSYFHPEEKIISIRDKAEETAYTDQAVVDLVVKTEDKLLAKAINLNSELRNTIRKELISSDLDGQSIKNSKFSSSPQYGWFGSKPSSFEVMNRVSVTIDSEKHLEILAKIADRYDEVTLSGTIFKHSKKEEFEKKVKQMALEKVLAKKSFYEKSLGIKLIPISFTESDIGFQATRGADMFEDEIVVTGIRASKEDSYSRKRKATSYNSDSFDEVKYHAVITVEFQVE